MAGNGGIGTEKGAKESLAKHHLSGVKFESVKHIYRTSNVSYQ